MYTRDSASEYEASVPDRVVNIVTGESIGRVLDKAPNGTETWKVVP